MLGLMPGRRGLGRVVLWLMLLALLAGLGVGGYFALQSTRGIVALLTENRTLKQAITNLTEQRQIGYAKVLAQETREGRLFTRLLFVVTDPDDQRRRLLEREYEIEGDVVHFDAMIARFGPQVVMDGKGRALYLWRRIYGEHTPPAQGEPIEIPGQEPLRYGEAFKELPVRERMLFWNEIWGLADDPERLKAAGVEAVYGSAVYKKLQPGLIYIFNLDASGTFYPETVPDI